MAIPAYLADLPLPSGRRYFSLQNNSVASCTPCGPSQWCVSTDMRQTMIDPSGRHPAQEFSRILAEDPLLGPAVAAGRRAAGSAARVAGGGLAGGRTDLPAGAGRVLAPVAP